jgi:hypothetical protein
LKTVQSRFPSRHRRKQAQEADAIDTPSTARRKIKFFRSKQKSPLHHHHSGEGGSGGGGGNRRVLDVDYENAGEVASDDEENDDAVDDFDGCEEEDEEEAESVAGFETRSAGKKSPQRNAAAGSKWREVMGVASASTRHTTTTTTGGGGGGGGAPAPSWGRQPSLSDSVAMKRQRASTRLRVRRMAQFRELSRQAVAVDRPSNVVLRALIVTKNAQTLKQYTVQGR